MTTVTSSTPDTLSLLLGGTTTRTSTVAPLNEVTLALMQSTALPTLEDGTTDIDAMATQLDLSAEVVSLLQGIPGADLTAQLLGASISADSMEALLRASESAAIVSAAYAAAKPPVDITA